MSTKGDAHNRQCFLNASHHVYDTSVKHYIQKYKNARKKLKILQEKLLGIHHKNASKFVERPVLRMCVMVSNRINQLETLETLLS